LLGEAHALAEGGAVSVLRWRREGDAAALSVGARDTRGEREPLAQALTEALVLGLHDEEGEPDGQFVAVPLLVALTVPRSDAVEDELRQGMALAEAHWEDEAVRVGEREASAERVALGETLLDGLSLALRDAKGEPDGLFVAAPMEVVLAVPHGDAVGGELPQGDGEELPVPHMVAVALAVAVKLPVADPEEVADSVAVTVSNLLLVAEEVRVKHAELLMLSWEALGEAEKSDLEAHRVAKGDSEAPLAVAKAVEEGDSVAALAVEQNVEEGVSVAMLAVALSH
jgi:hypothetical protein